MGIGQIYKNQLGVKLVSTVDLFYVFSSGESTETSALLNL